MAAEFLHLMEQLPEEEGYRSETLKSSKNALELLRAKRVCGDAHGRPISQS